MCADENDQLHSNANNHNNRHYQDHHHNNNNYQPSKTKSSSFLRSSINSNANRNNKQDSTSHHNHILIKGCSNKPSMRASTSATAASTNPKRIFGASINTNAAKPKTWTQAVEEKIRQEKEQNKACLNQHFADEYEEKIGSNKRRASFNNSNILCAPISEPSFTADPPPSFTIDPPPSFTTDPLPLSFATDTPPLKPPI